MFLIISPFEKGKQIIQMMESPGFGAGHVCMHIFLSVESCVTMKKSLCVSNPQFSCLKAELLSIYQASSGVVRGCGVKHRAWHGMAAQNAIAALVLIPSLP